MAQNLILVDSSVWIQCFREGSSIHRDQLDRLLADDRVAVCGPVKAEVLSGARSMEDYDKLSGWFEGLHDFSVDYEKAWDIIAERRFKLARKGIQQSLIDLLIACIAHENHVPVWTLDKDFKRMTDIIPVTIYRPDDR